MKYHKLKSEFKLIADEILSLEKSLQGWSEIESSDMFQKNPYAGGFDATEMEFCFSFYGEDKEYWFQLSLDDIIKYSEKKLTQVEVVEADYY